jgi:hypothetical protein
MGKTLIFCKRLWVCMKLFTALSRRRRHDQVFEDATNGKAEAFWIAAIFARGPRGSVPQSSLHALLP